MLINLNIAPLATKIRGLVPLLVLMAVLGWFASLAVAHAQELPAHFYRGTANVDGNPAPDGTTVSAWIDGRVVAKNIVKDGSYTLTVVQAQGQSYAGKTVTYRIGELQSGERRKWEHEGSTVVSLNTYTQGWGPQGRVPGRFIRECVLNALGWSPSSKLDLTARELKKAQELCPALKGRLGALSSGGGGGGSSQNDRQGVEQNLTAHIFRGNAVLSGGPAEDGTGVAAFIDGVHIRGTRTRDGRFHLVVSQAPGQSFAGRRVEFRGSTAQGRRFDWLKSAVWTGGETSITLGPNVRYSSRSGGLDGRSDTRTIRDRQPAADVIAHVFEGKALLFGEPAVDGTGVTAFIDGVRISGTKTSGGRFRLVVPQAPGQSFAGRMVEFRGGTVEGRRFDWLTLAAWTGGETSITLGPEVRFSSSGAQNGGPVEIPVGSPDLVTLECIRGVLGYLPFGPQEMTQEQRNVVAGACPGARGRMGQVLNPAAVDQSNRECAERVLGYLQPSIPAMTSEETQRVQAACFGGKPIPGAPGPNRGPTRGFFTNSASGSMNDVDKFMDPTTLAVLGILLTLVATSLSLVKGN